MENVKLEDNNYKLLKDYREAFNIDAITEKYTEYFYPYDYIIGDWSYGKLRLKGFYKKSNKNCRDFNNFENVENYIKTNCAYDCRYFVLEKS